jgi:hypothetical protein
MQLSELTTEELKMIISELNARLEYGHPADRGKLAQTITKLRTAARG